MSSRIFRTLRGRITLTDTMLIYKPRRRGTPRICILRADITSVRVVTTVYWFVGARTDVLVHHRDGVLTMPRVGQRTAAKLRAALGF
jgi:hypothetical protein